MPTALLLPPPDFQTFLRSCPCKVDDDDTALFDHARALGDHPSPSLSSSLLVSVVRKQPWKSVANWFNHSVNSEQK